MIYEEGGEKGERGEQDGDGIGRREGREQEGVA